MNSYPYGDTFVDISYTQLFELSDNNIYYKTIPQSNIDYGDVPYNGVNSEDVSRNRYNGEDDIDGTLYRLMRKMLLIMIVLINILDMKIIQFWMLKY